MINKLTKYALKFTTGLQGIVTMAIVSFTEAVFFVIPPDTFLGLLCIKKSYRELSLDPSSATIISVPS